MNRHLKRVLSGIRSALCISPAAFLFISCTTYSMPVAEPIRDDRITGRYVLDDRSYERVVLSLFEDGYFHEYVYYYEDDEFFSDAGTYFVEKSGLAIDFFFHADKAKWNYTAAVDPQFSRLSVDEYDLDKEAGSGRPINLDDRNDLPGTYILRYFTDERVIVELTLYREGRFREKSIYPDSEVSWTEEGSFTFSMPSGFISFEYDEWPEGAFAGILDTATGILHCVEGNYLRLF